MSEGRSLTARARDLVELSKPRLSFLVLCSAATGMWVAPGAIDAWRAALSLFFTAMVVGAANAFNSYLERDIDALMLRTRHRPLPAGRLSPRLALWLAVVASGGALAMLTWVANGLTAALGFLALLLYVVVYTPLKRHSSLAMPVGAIPGAIPPLMGWTTVTGSIDPAGLLLFGILFVWQLPHFIAISLFLKEDYARAGLKVFALVHGERVSRISILVFTIALLPVTLGLVPLQIAGLLYGVSAAVLGVLLLLCAATGLRRVVRPNWARTTFLATLGYLTLLLVALIVDRT
jgi:protoheme IX farnesyltransferase